MDLLQECAVAFSSLLPYEYRFTIGRKGNMCRFTIDFDTTDFHHLAGLHKLKDNVRFMTGKRSDIFNEVLTGTLTGALAEKSVFYPEMQPRLAPLTRLESFLDSNEIIFRFNEKINNFSLIKADYLLENLYKGNEVYLFVSQRSNSTNHVCRSFFPKKDKDYSVGQPRYTLLKKEKVNIKTNKVIIQYDRLTPK